MRLAMQEIPIHLALNPQQQPTIYGPTDELDPQVRCDFYAISMTDDVPHVLMRNLAYYADS